MRRSLFSLTLVFASITASFLVMRFVSCVDLHDDLQVSTEYCRLLWRFGLRSVIFLRRFYVAPFAWRVRSRFFHVSHRLHPILQPCPLWPCPFLERLLDAVLSSKIKHPRLAQPKLVLERFKNRMNRVPIRPQFAKFFVPHGDIVGSFVDYVKERWRNVNPPPLLCPPFFAIFRPQ